MILTVATPYFVAPDVGVQETRDMVRCISSGNDLGEEEIE